MHRRDFLKTAGAAAVALGAPASVRAFAQDARTLRFIPNADLAILDPIVSPAYVTRNHAYMIFDTLYGQDSNYEIQPQMVEGHMVEDDGRLWKLALRDGLIWHDGEPVLARDCVASIKRWAARDPFGTALVEATDELSAIDDKTIQFRLKTPFPLLPQALGKPGVYMAAMMPERLANTDPAEPLTEMVGSGPFRFMAEERVPGARNVYARFEGYQPRSGGTADWTAGPKVVHFDRVEWTTIADPSTAASALQTGEQDWWETPAADLLPIFAGSSDVTVSIQDPLGSAALLRFNHLQPPFNNPAIRRALLGAIDQTAFMQTIVGQDEALYRIPLGLFPPGSSLATNAGLEPFAGPRDLDRVKADLAAAGYSGEKVVFLVQTNYPDLKALCDVAVDMMQRCGMNVEYAGSDEATLFQRRANKGPVEEGGWSCFITKWGLVDWLNPAGHIPMRANGEKAYAGWPNSQAIEELRVKWLSAPDLATQKAVAEELQVQFMEDLPFIPLGNFFQPVAYRSDLAGVLKGHSMFWNVKRSGA